MKRLVIVLFVLNIMLSCSDEETPSDCQLIEAFESQDYENGGEVLKYEFTFNNELLSQVDKSFVIDDVPYLFYSVLYEYDNQDHLIRVEKIDPSGNLLNFTELTYNGDLMVGYVTQSATSPSREERTILYDSDNTINRVNYSFYQNDETEPFDTYYIMVNRTEEKVTVSYFNMEDEFTGSREVNVSTLPLTNSVFPLLFDRYYQSELYLLTSVPTQLVSKDKDGNTIQTSAYDYTIEDGLIKDYILNQGVRNDRFEFNYSCK